MNKEEKHVHDLLENVPIFWINLERSKDRRAKMEAQLNKYNLNHTRIEAVDGDNLNYKQQYCRNGYNINIKMSKYEIDCALSHIKTIQHCYDKGLEYALILEDDATFEYFPYKTDTILCLLKELKSINGEKMFM